MKTFHIKKPTIIDVTGDNDNDILLRMRELCEEYKHDYTVTIRTGCRLDKAGTLQRKLKYHTYQFEVKVENGVVTARTKYENWELFYLIIQNGGGVELTIHPDWPYGYFEKFFRRAFRMYGRDVINEVIGKYLNGDFNLL